MDKATRAEMIATLTTDKYSGFKQGDEAMLETASDARLEEFRTASESRRNSAADGVRVETDLRNTSARLKVAEDRIKESEKPMTKEEFIARAPEDIKKTLETLAAEETELKMRLISKLSTLGVKKEDQLKALSVNELQELARWARVDVLLPDFSGRGVPRAASENTPRSFAPPNSYEQGLKEMREREAKR